MSEASLEEFLRPVSAALGRTGVSASIKAVPDTARGLGLDELAGLTQAELANRFEAEARALGTRVTRAHVPEVAAAIIEQLSHVGAQRVVYADDPWTDDCGLPATLAATSLTATRWDATNPQASIDACARADAGVTFPLAGIAYSGTLTEVADERCGRSVSLLPATHVAVLRACDIVARIHTLLADLEQHVRAGHTDVLPSSLTFVSGPSNTADIELVRVVGVHGPINTAIVLVEA